MAYEHFFAHSIDTEPRLDQSEIGDNYLDEGGNPPMSLNDSQKKGGTTCSDYLVAAADGKEDDWLIISPSKTEKQQ